MTSLAAAAPPCPSDETPFDVRHQHQQQQYQNHLLALQSQRQSHQAQPQPHPQHQTQLQQGIAPLSNRQMLAAQQHFGMAMQQQSQQPREGQAGSTPSGGWNDDSELFLRNLLANSTDSPPSSVSGGSYMATSPSYVNGGSSVDDNRNSLSPSSSSGFQSLHDFIHNSNHPTPPFNDASAFNGQTPEFINGKPGMVMHPQQPHMPYHAQQHPIIDPNALEYFVNSMVQNGDGQMPLATQGSGLDPSLLSPSYNYTSGNPAYAFQPHVFGQQSLPPQQYQQMQQSQHQQHQMHQQHPALDGRKRSAPGTLTEEVPVLNAPTASSAPRSKKKARRQSSSGPTAPATPSKPPSPVQQQPNQSSSFLPRMEVGSNATALAAIERLKAKRRAEVELRLKQEETLASQPKKEGGKGMGGKMADGSRAFEPAQKNQKKVAHNAIERRYRNNINDRISALRNAVPALRELRPKKPGNSRKGKGAQEQDLVDGVPAATKLNKATILGKATEYIRYLKGRETRLVSEVAGLRELIRSLEGGEELLDLWEGEMEKVVAEQEAKAKEAFALEDESFDFGADEEEDEEEEEEEESDIKPISPSSSQSSSRYMMGIFMGFSVLGGGVELVSEHAAASTSHGRVFGASHQLLKRGMAATNVKLAGVVDAPHHYDHVPSHVLAVEVMRGLALVACLAFVFWPVISRFFTVHGAAKRQSRREELLELDERRRQMLDSLARSPRSPHEMDVTMRKFVQAPRNALHGAAALVNFTGQELSCRLGLQSRTPMDEEHAVVWCRLLELETSLGPLAQRSLLVRLHTLLRVATLPNVGYGTKSKSILLNPARVYGTMAIAMVRAARGNSFVLNFAERRWTMAKRCRLLAKEEIAVEEEEQQKGSRDVQDRWLDSVLDHSLADAMSLCPSPTAVAATFSPKVDATTRASLLAPLPSIAAIQHGRQLTSVWSTLLSQIVKSTCPTGQNSDTPTTAEFMKHHTDMKIYLALVSSREEQDQLSGQISRLALTAPKYENWQTVSNVTYGTWALLVGNVSVARSVAAALLTAGDPAELPACAEAFVKLVFDGTDVVAATLPNAGAEAVNEVDALAAAALTWLQFLKLLSATVKGQEGDSAYNDSIVQKALDVRRYLACARIARVAGEEGNAGVPEAVASHRDSVTSSSSSMASYPSSDASTMSDDGGREQGAQLDESLDTLTDILSLLGRKAALGTLGDWKNPVGEQHDSGVEWDV